MNIKTRILLLLALQAQYQSCKVININDKLQYSGYVIGIALILYGYNLERNIGRQSQEAINNCISNNSANNCACKMILYSTYDGGSVCSVCGSNYEDKIMTLSKSFEDKPYNIKISGAAIISANALYHLLIKLRSLYYKSS